MLMKNVIKLIYLMLCEVKIPNGSKVKAYVLEKIIKVANYILYKKQVRVNC